MPWGNKIYAHKLKEIIVKITNLTKYMYKYNNKY